MVVVEKGEVDGHRRCTVGDEVFDVAVAPGAFAVEGDAQGLEDGGLAGAGVAENADQ